MSLMEGEQKLRRKPYFFMALFFTERQKSLVILAEELLKSIVKKVFVFSSMQSKYPKNTVIVCVSLHLGGTIAVF